MAGIILIALGTGLIIWAFAAAKKSRRMAAELESFKAGALEYSAAVLDTTEEEITLPSGKKKKRKSVIIQIRIEEQKKTLVHRCDEAFYKDYKRGDRVNVLFIEGMPADRALISGDNRYERFIELTKTFRLPSTVLGAVIIVIGTLLLM